MNSKVKAVVVQTSNDNMKTICEFLKNYNYEIAGTTVSGLEAVDLIEQTKPDVVFADVYLRDIDACGMIDALGKKELEKTPVYVIATVLGSGRVIENVLSYGIDLFTLIPFDGKYMDGRLRETIAKKRTRLNRRGVIKNAGINDEFDLLSYVSQLMHEVGVPASLRGYDYIRESIILALTDRKILKSITKQLYPSIAKKNETTPSRVERAIRHAVEVAWQRGDVDVLNGIFGYTVKSSKGKPTNGEFISMLTERVRLELKIS